MAGIYGNTPDYIGKASGFMQQASQSYASQQKKVYMPKPEKTAGGGLLSAASMGAAGAIIGPELSAAEAAGGYGLAIGAIVGLGAYLLS